VAQPILTALQTDITTLDVEVVVNAANRALSMGGGVCGAIFEAAGVSELSAACAALGGCNPGDAKATPGFRLPARWVVHTVGPVWQGGHLGEAGVLASCYRRSVEVANGLGARSIAFPAISTGIYGFPRALASQIAVATLSAGRSGIERIVLVAFDPETLRQYEALVAGEGLT
jgi:O-acetyl-ADP-ribose deacetylase